ncbi:hypothetical protein L3Q82_012077 [Scortum barcoo]|uniref:Uncharacterized protein n=1 Tax=Scortum barcoo TaxID=214431 RepID=A0ACB8W6V4_9TELE|nr:hypothetical protein L3Q82_012077 [Scortum barcoo]
MEPSSPKKIQFAVPPLQGQLDPQAAEHIRRRRPTPATLQIYRQPGNTDVGDQNNASGEPQTSEASQRKQSTFAPPTMKEVCQELRGESSTFQLPEEEESLLSLLYQVSCVHGPGQVRCDVDVQELDIVDTLNCFPVDEERSVLCPPGPPVVHYDLLGLAGVQNKLKHLSTRGALLSSELQLGVEQHLLGAGLCESDDQLSPITAQLYGAASLWANHNGPEEANGNEASLPLANQERGAAASNSSGGNLFF